MTVGSSAYPPARGAKPTETTAACTGRLSQLDMQEFEGGSAPLNRRADQDRQARGWLVAECVASLLPKSYTPRAREHS